MKFFGMEYYLDTETAVLRALIARTGLLVINKDGGMAALNDAELRAAFAGLLAPTPPEDAPK